MRLVFTASSNVAAKFNKKTEQGFHLRTLKMGILSLEVILIRLIYTYIIFASPSVFLSLFLSPPLQKKTQVDVIIYSL